MKESLMMFFQTAKFSVVRPALVVSFWFLLASVSWAANQDFGEETTIGVDSDLNLIVGGGPGLGNTLGDDNYGNIVGGSSNSTGAAAYDNLVVGYGNSLGDDSINNAISGSENSLGIFAENNLVSGRDNVLEDDSSGNLVTGTGSSVTGASNLVAGDGNMVVGDNNVATMGATVTGSNNIGMGSGAESSATNTVAIGNGAEATHANSVAIGSGSVTGADNTISVGALGSERRITNVARGLNVKDAVNVEQLEEVSDAVIFNGEEIVRIEGRVDDNAMSIGDLIDDVTTLNGIVSGSPEITDAIEQVWVNKDDIAANSNAISQNADVLNEHADAIVNSANAIVSLDGRVSSNSTEIEEMKLGLASAGLISNGEEAAASANGAGSTAVGLGASARSYDTAVGYRATVTADNSVALGANALVEAENSVALGADAHVTANAVGSVALGQGSVADEPNVVSVGSASNQRRVTQVADGVSAYDAVNVRQLQQVYSNTNRRFDLVDQRVKDLRKESFAGIASVAALAAIPDPKPGRKNSVGVGYGNYKGENALAVGFKSDVSENLRLTTGVATARDDMTANIGLGWSW